MAPDLVFLHEAFLGQGIEILGGGQARHFQITLHELDLGVRVHEQVVDQVLTVEETAGQTITTIHAIKSALFDYKHRIRAGFKFYSQDLINNLFMHPYTKIEFVQRDLKVSRLTATKYLDALAEEGFVQKHKIGRHNYYVNIALNGILAGARP